jgi:hypothetical protein
MTTSPPSFRIFTGISRWEDNDIVGLSLDTEDALLNHAVFTTPTVPLITLGTQRTTFYSSMTEARKLGIDRIRAKNAAKLVLVDSLISNAHYCMSLARHDVNTLLSSGYEVISKNRSTGPLDPPSILDMFNNISGQLLVRAQGVLNGRNYQVRVSTDGGKTWIIMGTFNSPRRMLLQPVTSGLTYMVEVCALGGSTNQSLWSEPMSRMAT